MPEPTPEEIAAARLYSKAVNTPPSAETAAAINERLEKGDLPRRKIGKREAAAEPDEGEVLVTGPREVIEVLYRGLGKTLGVPEWTPPPPGDTREQLPDDILAMLAPRMYLSTACEMAEACRMAVVRHPDRAVALMHWAEWLHEKRCRLNNKYSGAKCACPCHVAGEES